MLANIFDRHLLAVHQATGRGQRLLEGRSLLLAVLGVGDHAKDQHQFDHPILPRRSVRLGLGLAVLTLGAPILACAASSEAPPLSPAQTALFETPHLSNIAQPETLDYRFEQTGPAAFADQVAVHIDQIHPDGTKSVSIEFLTGAHHAFFPAVDDFSGNPLLMAFLEHDVGEMKDQVGVAAAYFRNRIRTAFIDQAQISDTTIQLDGRSVPARRIVLKPFAADHRFDRLPTVQGKTYDFVLSDQVPGQLAELATEVPADPAAGAPAWAERLTFVGEKP